MRISDWSSDVCSSDLNRRQGQTGGDHQGKPGKGRLGSADLQGDAEVMGQSLSPYAAKPAFGTGVPVEQRRVASGAGGPGLDQKQSGGWMPLRAAGRSAGRRGDRKRGGEGKGGAVRGGDGGGGSKKKKT